MAKDLPIFQIQNLVTNFLKNGKIKEVSKIDISQRKDMTVSIHLISKNLTKTEIAMELNDLVNLTFLSFQDYFDEIMEEDDFGEETGVVKDKIFSHQHLFFSFNKFK